MDIGSSPRINVVALPHGAHFKVLTVIERNPVEVCYDPIRCHVACIVRASVLAEQGIDHDKLSDFLNGVINQGDTPSMALLKLAKTFELLEQGRLINAK